MGRHPEVGTLKALTSSGLSDHWTWVNFKQLMYGADLPLELGRFCFSVCPGRLKYHKAGHLKGVGDTQ